MVLTGIRRLLAEYGDLLAFSAPDDAEIATNQMNNLLVNYSEQG